MVVRDYQENAQLVPVFRTVRGTLHAELLQFEKRGGRADLGGANGPKRQEGLRPPAALLDIHPERFADELALGPVLIFDDALCLAKQVRGR